MKTTFLFNTYLNFSTFKDLQFKELFYKANLSENETPDYHELVVHNHHSICKSIQPHGFLIPSENQETKIFSSDKHMCGCTNAVQMLT